MAVGSLALLQDRDREVLRFLAAIRLALAEHVMVLLGGKTLDLAEQVLDGLLTAGLVRHERVMRPEPDCFLITHAGLGSIGSDLAPPEFDPRYRHHVGVAWIWLAGRGGAWGPPERIMTAREMRSKDTQRSHSSQGASAGADRRRDPTPSAPPLGIRVPDDDGDRLHYPDLLLIRGRRRVAVELQLGAPSPRQLDQLLTGYAADQRITTIVCLVTDPNVGNAVRSATTRRESPPVVIQPARFDTAPYPTRPND